MPSVKLAGGAGLSKILMDSSSTFSNGRNDNTITTAAIDNNNISTTAMNNNNAATTAVVANNTPIRTFFLAVFALYVISILLYLLQNRISIFIGYCFRRRRRGRTSSSLPQSHNNSTSHQERQYRDSYNLVGYRIVTSYCCSQFRRVRQMIFAIRWFVFNYRIEQQQQQQHHHLEWDHLHQLKNKGRRDDNNNYPSWTVSQVTSWAYSKLLQDHQQQQQRRGRRTNNNTTGMIFSDIHFSRESNNYYDDTPRELEDDDEYFEYYEHQRAIRNAIAIMKQQRIDGTSLTHLTLDRLINFGIAFGVAVRLVACLEELIPNRFAATLDNDEEQQQQQQAGGGGGEELPSWYVSNDVVVTKNNHDGSRNNNNDGVVFESSEDGEQDHLVMSEKAQSIMKERFGMSLPDLRGQTNPFKRGDDDDDDDDDDDEAQDADPYNAKQQYLAEKPPPSSPTFRNNDRHTNGTDGGESTTITDNGSLNEAATCMTTSSSLPMIGPHHAAAAVGEIFNSMPPQIRAVAERRPDLVSELLQHKQQMMMVAHNQQTTTSSTSTTTSLSPLFEEEEKDHHDIYPSEEEINIDQESVSLLRRRTNNR